MKWEDTGLVLSARKFSERDAVVTLLTRQHGLWRAMVKGGCSRQNRSTYEPGNLLLARWNARLAEHMGNFSCELLEQNAALLMQDGLRLSLLSSLCALLEGVLQERDPHPALYEQGRQLITILKEQVAGAEALKNYALFEFLLLSDAGFGLDLSCCAATGAEENLVYISPKTGRAVCREAGAPYHDKMLPLPAFFHEEDSMPKPAEILDALRVTGYFLQLWLYEPRGRKLPPARERLLGMLERECVVANA